MAALRRATAAGILDERFGGSRCAGLGAVPAAVLWGFRERIAMIEDGAFQELATAFYGQLIRPADGPYDDARRIWNRLIDKHPALIAGCADADDVAHSVRSAREHELVLAVRGGGHNIAGNCVCDGGLMVDLSLMKSIQVDPERRTARAQPGLTLGEF